MNHKNNRQPDDEMISSLVRSVKYKIPGHVERRIDDAMDLAVSQTHGNRQVKRYALWYPLSAAAALVIIAVLAIFQPFIEKTNQDPAPAITEIKTQLELKDKNIKILWVQKKDFELKLNP